MIAFCIRASVKVAWTLAISRPVAASALRKRREKVGAAPDPACVAGFLDAFLDVRPDDPDLFEFGYVTSDMVRSFKGRPVAVGRIGNTASAAPARHLQGDQL